MARRARGLAAVGVGLALAVGALLGVPKRLAVARTLASDEVRVVVATGVAPRSCRYVRDALISVLEEEGIPFLEVPASLLLSTEPDSLRVQRTPAVIVPDCAAQSIPSDFGPWSERYVRSGGVLLAAFDAGTRLRNGAFRQRSVLAGVLGVNASTYERRRDKAFVLGRFQLLRPEWVDIPPGKFDARLQLLTGYIYGPLTYPAAAAELVARDVVTIAEIVTSENERFPALTLRRRGRGWAVFVNLPVGHLKAYSDDLPLRSVLRLALLRLAHVPHRHPSPHARGGLVINWHVDAQPDRPALAFMLREGYVRPGLRYSFHVTAGPFRDRPGDGLGFDACGVGRPLVRAISRFGAVGSHGGWGHNWFSTNVLRGRFGPDSIAALIRRNSACLEQVTGQRVIEYSAPNGVHPQPVTTRILERLGFVAYYYAGDSGSPPNRTFLGGEQVSRKVWAFPVMTFGRAASLTELGRAGVPEAEVERRLRALLAYVTEHRTVRLFYSHPYDVARYPRAVLAFVDAADSLERAGRLEIEPMQSYAAYLARFVETDRHVRRPDARTLRIQLEHPRTVADIPVAVPRGYRFVRGWSERPVRLLVDRDARFSYYYALVPTRWLDLEFRRGE